MGEEPPRIEWSLLSRVLLSLPFILLPLIGLWTEKAVWRYVLFGLTLLGVPVLVLSNEKLKRVIFEIFRSPTSESKISMDFKKPRKP